MKKEDKVTKETMRMIIEEEKEQLFEMANLQPRTTGLKTVLYSTFDDDEESYQHSSPRVKIKTINAGRFPILLEPSVEPLNNNGEYDRLKNEDLKIVDEAVEYVKENKESFLSHWYGRIGDEQLRKVLTGIMSLKEAEEDAMQNGVE